MYSKVNSEKLGSVGSENIKVIANEKCLYFLYNVASYTYLMNYLTYLNHLFRKSLQTGKREFQEPHPPS